MKSFFLFTALTITCLLSSCNSLLSGDATFSVLIDGDLFESSIAAGAATELAGQLTLAINAPASDLSLSTSGLFVNSNDFEVGTYSLDLNQAEAGFTYTQIATDPKTTYSSDSGTVIITEKNAEAKTVVGTFSGTMVNIENDSLTLEFTDGQFNISYIE